MSNIELIKTYNIPGPRYTSYPTVPHWSGEMEIKTWTREVKKAFDVSNTEEGISLYLHLPFCESLCTFCGCNKRITKQHSVERPYIETILKEWRMYLKLFGEKPRLAEVHLGGGTPTFFSPKNLHYLMSSIFEDVELMPNVDMGFEGHPRNTTKEHLEVFYSLGFRRVSFGIQDFNKKVQLAINRIQTKEQVVAVHNQAKEIGYTSINFDLIYGLPFQDAACLQTTFEEVLKLRPDRIAYYSYAHVPWNSPGQRAYSEADLPEAEEKFALYIQGKDMLENSDYKEIGMDHFALPEDSLYQAFDAKKLHRNFMGYTPNSSTLMVGLGVSSIGDAWTAFGQNLKKVEDYTAAIERGEFPIFRGHLLSATDVHIRKHILNLMCHFETNISKEDSEYKNSIIEKLQPMVADNLIEVSEEAIIVKRHGRQFVRNVCMAFDPYLDSVSDNTQRFSKTI